MRLRSKITSTERVIDDANGEKPHASINCFLSSTPIK
jgi:hypothetical protein